MSKPLTSVIVALVALVLVLGTVSAAGFMPSTQDTKSLLGSNNVQSDRSCDPKGADFNEDGSVNANDVNAFIIAFNKEDSRADMNCDSLIDSEDRELFISLYLGEDFVDIAATKIAVSDETPEVGQDISIKVIFRNLGTLDSEYVEWGYEIISPDDTGTGSEVCCLDINAGDMHIPSFGYTPMSEGEYEIRVWANPVGLEDINGMNNNLRTRFTVSESQNRDMLYRIGDFNLDGEVNSIDLTLMLNKMGTAEPLFDEDGSGLVDEADLEMLKANMEQQTMLRADLVHSSGHCKVSNAEVALVEKHIDEPMDDVLTRLADLDNDGSVTEIDADLMRRQRDIAGQLGYEAQPSIDINCDGSVDNADLKLVLGLWGQQEFDYSWADVDEDEQVGVSDFLEVLSSFT